MNHLELTKQYWKTLLHPSDLAIDATCGNGHDTLFLSELSSVISLDIQEAAIRNTEALLASKGKKATLYRLNHADIDSLSLPHSPRLIVYNLGYLPGGDKSLTTLLGTTLISVEKAKTMLAEDGALSITCYPGHKEGAIEEKALCNWAEKLSYKEWRVCHHRWINRTNAPSILWIEKIGK
ncbi:MAG: hypothetical protein ACD_17C00133G0004 [uncultured bacterium]|nr:MAG: hypothetical protein ACD_17C00133G0004 [uncultured bacterium]OGN57667.1 MAG: hypothetical protein A3C42_06610 [Chlamydiae bacterium RIFCSPHIGHO2_02_FULL_45_9]OGN60215.1 MAG: hypothetical protein A3D96_05215 [Chlamydiae bacterium RIFCSPHIGHO2_12_FULL_44_59]